MALTQISTDGIKNGTITGSDLATNVDLADNQRLRLGTGNDLEIFHNNDNSFINDSGTGQLMIQASGLRLRNYPEGHTQINCQDDVVELYYNNSKKFETISSGVQVSGTLFIPDGGQASNRISVGNSGDLQIFHDGSNSKIVEGGTGSLIIQTSNFNLDNAGGTENILTATENGAVELYFDGSKKFETQNLGVTVTGGVYPAAADTYQLGGSSLRWNELNIKSVIDVSDNGKIRMGDSDDLQIFHNGSDSIIDETGTGNLKIRNSGANKLTVDGNGIILDGKITTIGSGYGSTVFNEDGADVDFRVEGDTQASLFKVDAGNDRVGIGESDPSTVFQVTQFNHAFADSTSSLATVPSKSVARFRGSNNASGSLFIGNESNAAKCYLQGCNDTGNGSIDILLNPFGANVGIGTTSPSQKLQVTSGNILLDGTDQFIYLSSDADQWLSANAASNYLRIGTGNAERVRIESSGRVIVKTSGINLENATATNSRTYSITNAAGTTGWTFGNGVIASAHQFVIYDNTAGAARMLIDSDGDVLIGKTSSNLDNAGTHIDANGQVFKLVKSGTGAGPLVLNRSTNVGTFIEFRRGSGNTVGTISSNNTTTSYNTSSDYRLKENATAISDGITRLKTLKPYRFNFKADADTTVDGFFAHEVTAVPEAITGTKDEVDSDNNPVYQSIDQSKIVPLLVAALQEAIGRIEALETEVAALKAA